MEGAGVVSCELRGELEWDKLTVDVLLDGLVGQHGTAVDVHLVANGNVVTKDRHVLQTSPLANAAVPADNGGLDPGVVLDAAVLKHYASLQTHTVANDHVRANGDIWSNTAVLANLGRGVNQDVASVHVRLRRRGEQLRTQSCQRGEVETCAGDEVLGLSDIHPEALQIEGV